MNLREAKEILNQRGYRVIKEETEYSYDEQIRVIRDTMADIQFALKTNHGIQSNYSFYNQSLNINEFDIILNSEFVEPNIVVISVQHYDDIVKTFKIPFVTGDPKYNDLINDLADEIDGLIETVPGISDR